MGFGEILAVPHGEVFGPQACLRLHSKSHDDLTPMAVVSTLCRNLGEELSAWRLLSIP